MKQLLAALLALTMLLSLAACAKTTDTTPSDAAQTAASDSAEPTTLTYGSADYTRINPAMDEHGEINLLLFDGLTAHDGENNVVPGLAETWELDEATNTYTFHLRENLTWHDGEPLYTIPGMPPTLIDPPAGDAFAERNEYALAIDYREAPPMFRITDTHFAATWLLDPRAPKVAPPLGGLRHE